MKEKRRNIGLAALLAVCALVLAACEFRIHTDLVVEEDGSGVLSLEMSVDDQLAGLAESGMGMDMDMDMGEGEGPVGQLIDDEWVPDGWTIEVVSGDYQGIRASTEFDDLDGLEQRLADLAVMDGVDIPMTTGAGGMLTSGMSLAQEGDALVFRLVIPDQSDALFEGMEGMEGMEGDFPVDLSMLDDVFDLRFTLTLPGEIVAERTNADLITGQTLVWNLALDDGGRVLEAQSQLPRSGASMIIVWAIVALALAAAVYLVIDRRRRQAAAAPAAPESPDPAAEVEAEVEEASPEDS